MPPKELLFVYPPDVPGPESAGAAIIRDLPPQDAWMAVKVHRVMSLWAHPHSAGAPVFPMRALEELEKELLYVTWDLGHRDPPDAGAAFAAHLSYMITSLVTQDIVDTGDVAQTCLGVTTWAAERGYYATGSAFMELAAYIAWDCPNWAWLAGRWFRMRGRSREAETWYRRAARLARWKEDWEWVAYSLTSLAGVLVTRGNYQAARAVLQRGLRVARRYRLRDSEGEIQHDLFVLCVYAGWKDAEEHARVALQCYLPQHDRLPALAYDVAYFWMTKGLFARAITVLESLVPRMPHPEQQAQIYSALARAAGALMNRGLFEDAWERCWELIEERGATTKRPAILLDLALGAGSIGLTDQSIATAEMAAREAVEQGESDLVHKANEMIAMIRELDPHRLQERNRAVDLSGDWATSLVLALRG